MRVLVCGGRDYNDRGTMFAVLDRAHAANPITEILQGSASGADRLAYLWAMRNGVLAHGFLADWKALGKKAGPIRNQKMADAKPDLVIAFPGGKGTADMVRRAHAAGIQVQSVVE